MRVLRQGKDIVAEQECPRCGCLFSYSLLNEVEAV